MRAILPLPPDIRGEKTARICEAILKLPAWHHARIVALFAPQPREPDVELLWQHAAGRRFAYPRIESESVALYSVESLYELQPSRWEIREPRALPEFRVAPDSVDLILVPGVAFTRSGQRCGRGGGFYDRLLAPLPPTAAKVGVCFSEQLVDAIPCEPHDIAVDTVIFA